MASIGSTVGLYPSATEAALLICDLSLECFFLQALMTGSLPGFVDVIRNLNSPVLLEDNVIRQAKAAGKRMIFYGDETWLKLFPKHFVEYDGTTSFFVSDYTEVSFPPPNYKVSCSPGICSSGQP